MRITLHCCGEDYYADEMHIGNHIKCRKCGRLLKIESKTRPVHNPSGYPIGSHYWHVVRQKCRGLVSRRSFVFGGVLLSALALWILFARFASQAKQSITVPEAQMPVPSKVFKVDPNPKWHPIVPSSSPQVLERVPVSLRTGKWIIRPRGVAGRGILTIENGSELDAVVKLAAAYPPQRTIWKLYIRAHEQYTVPTVAGGNYLLQFALGRDWDSGTKKFLFSNTFYQAGEHLEFTEVEPTLDEQGTYTEMKISLNPVFGGNLRRERIDETTFDEGDNVSAP